MSGSSRDSSYSYSRKRSRSRSPIHSSRSHPSSSRSDSSDRRYSSYERRQWRDCNREGDRVRSSKEYGDDQISSSKYDYERSWRDDDQKPSRDDERRPFRDYDDRRDYSKSSRGYNDDNRFAQDDFEVEQKPYEIDFQSNALTSLRYYLSDNSQDSQSQGTCTEDISDDEIDPMEQMLGVELKFLEGEKKEKKTRVMGFSCDVCNLAVNNVKALQDHFAGSKHKKALAKRGLSQELDHLVKLPKDQAVWGSLMRCTLCNVIVQGTEINVHSENENHKEMVAKATHNNPSHSASETKWYEVVNAAGTNQDYFDISEHRYECKLCCVVLPKKDQFENHIKGKRHQKKLRWQLISDCEPEDGGHDTAQFWCSVCNIFCSTSEALDKHFSGKQHGRMLRAKGVSEDQIEQGLEENLPVNHAPVVKGEMKPDPSVKSEKKGLYGSLPQVLEAQQSGNQTPAAASKSQAKRWKPRNTQSSSSSAGPSNPHPLSVGAFLQSLLSNNEDAEPPREKPVKEEPVEEEDTVTQYLDRISHQHRFANPGASRQQAARPSSNHFQHSSHYTSSNTRRHKTSYSSSRDYRY